MLRLHSVPGLASPPQFPMLSPRYPSESPSEQKVVGSPSRARTLEAGERWARLAQARAASRPGLCAIAPGRRAGEVAELGKQKHRKCSHCQLVAL